MQRSKDSQDIDIYEEIDKQAEAINRAIKRERKELKNFIDDLKWRYEASASGTENSALKEIYLFKAQGLADLLKELEEAEQLEAEIIGTANDYEGADIGTATAKEIEAQNLEPIKK